MIKLREYLGQTFQDSDEADVVDQAELDAGYQRWEVIHGEGQLPPEGADVAVEQYSAFCAALKLNAKRASGPGWSDCPVSSLKPSGIAPEGSLRVRLCHIP